MFDRIEDLLLSFKGILYYIFFLRKSCYWATEQIERYQYNKLKKLLLVCEKKVPYYRRLFHEIDFDVRRDFKSLADLKKIPITTKKNVVMHWSEFINTDYAGKAIECSTSGSTGMPLTVMVSKNQWVVEQGTVWRHWSWSGYHFRDKMAIVRSYVPQNGVLIKKDKIRNFIYYSPYDMTEENMRYYLEHMCAEKVKFLRGYPSSLETLAAFVLKTGCDIPKLKGIFSASEVLSEETKRIIEKAFTTKVTNWYGLAECVITMGDCEKHEGMHIFEEYGYTEFLDTVDENKRRIVGTNLHNYAMPLIRYETNDIAQLGTSCSCRRNQRAIQNIIGRNNSVMKLKDRDIPITNFYTLMEHYPQTLSWQIVQHGIDKVELIVEKKLTEEVEQELISEFRTRLPEEITFLINQGEPVKQAEGKKLAFVRLEQ